MSSTTGATASSLPVSKACPARCDSRAASRSPPPRDGDAYLSGHRRIDRRTEDDLRLRVHRVTDPSAASFTSYIAMSGPPVMLNMHAVRAFHGGLGYRRSNGFLRRVGGAVLAAPLADAHHRRARIAHDRLDVGKIQIDEPGWVMRSLDARDSLAHRTVVGVIERFVEWRLLFDDLQDTFVRNGD